MKMTIQEFCGYRLKLERAPGDETTTIAELAQFVEFDPAAARSAGTSEHCFAFDALVAEYGGCEMAAGEKNLYDGFWMRFVDGSAIKYFN